MKKYSRILRFVLVVFATAAIAPLPAQAAEQLVLTVDQSRLVKLKAAPATIVVGNPSVADVTTDGNTMFFHPRGFGVTNVLVLDIEGRKLGDFLVRIVYEDSYGVAMYGPGGRETYTCLKDCEPTMRVGDAIGFFDNYQVQLRNKSSLAATQALGEELLTTRQTTTPYVISVPSNP